MSITKIKLMHVFGFAIFTGFLSIFLVVGSQDEIRTGASYLWPYGFWFTVMTIFLIRTYIGSVEMTEIDTGCKRIDLLSIVSMFDTASSLLVELAIVFWVYASFVGIGFGAATPVYWLIHPFEQFASYAVIPYLAVVTHYTLKAMIETKKKAKKKEENTPIGITIHRV